MIESLEFPIEEESKIILPFDGAFVMSYIRRLFYSIKAERTHIYIDDKRVSIEGEMKRKVGSARTDIKREDFKGFYSRYKGLNLIGLIIGSIIFMAAIVLGSLMASEIIDIGDEIVPIIVECLLLLTGIIIIILSLIKWTIFQIRFVDRQSIRYITVKIRKNPLEFYQRSKIFIEKYWSLNK